MKLLALLPLALVAAGCGTPPNEIMAMRDGTLRAPTYVQAADYCQNKGATARMLGKAPAESGVLFQCN